ncbi:hypothetical protein [Paraburkholderia hospita]|uniref:hypothetical protein n=1 Tax=Paraburkholderia hospita TaxID=169430 RepID=UPI00027193D9|nr:hypothetical protein [Paraburkholderia hospita]EUC17000.1 hypothetical protein PMI06_000496 [Burkholderia sp. BT03]SKD03575.1 hypothetical protein SAMN06266956_8235 [Paraburkholderia hospita]
MPLTFDELIELLDKSISVAGDSKSKKEFLADIFQPMTYGEDTELDPDVVLDLPQTKTILAKLITLTTNETKASYGARPELRAERLTALKQVQSWVAGGSTTSPVFSNVNRFHVAVQVALRVRRPSSMNQGPQGFCGPASILVPLVRACPLDYVGFVGDLFDKGIARFGETDVDVQQANPFRHGWTAACGPAADFIALGSLRCNIEAFVAAPLGGGQAFDFLSKESHATTPGQIATLLTQAGYRTVQNQALTDYTSPRDGTRLSTAGTNLTSCSSLFRRAPDCVVIMLVHGTLATNAKRSAVIQGDAHVPKLSDLHWILVRRIEADATNLPTGRVKMKLYTWKWSGLGDFAMKDFLPRYYGYVSAEL